jgi:hypothetical protein
MDTLLNQLIGYVGCICLTIGIYYSNLWVSFAPPDL